uniref:Putative glucose/ribitol dehydrogenase n=1 Tax=Helianthus annuus TaxID=4232 RepID=A0A251VAH6_HELAN
MDQLQFFGPTSGIGLETARVLALRGVHVVMAARNVKAATKCKEDIIKGCPNATIDVMELDLSSLESVRNFANEYISKGLPLNILVCNAGVMALPFTLTKDGIESQFATNYLGHFHLTNLLLDTMKNTAKNCGKEGRIVIVSSELYKMTYKEGIMFDKLNDEKCYNSYLAYGQSKLANILHANELARRLKEEGADITVNSLHPGLIATNLSRHSSCMSMEGKSGFSAKNTAEDVTKEVDGHGLTAIITGPTSGIGLETARVLALRGVHVVMAARNVESATKCKENIIKGCPNATIDVMELDVSSLESVRNFANEYISKGLPLNILICNAGVMALPFTLTKDGIESQFATNYLGHFHLTNLLLDTMKNTAKNCGKEGRIVIVSSELYTVTYKEGIMFDKLNDKKSYQSYYAYGQSKLANILHANELARRLKEEGADITVNSLHPGVIATNLSRHSSCMSVCVFGIARHFQKNIPQGASTTCYLALNPNVKGVSGEYFADNNVAKLSRKARDPEFAKKLWECGMELTNSK